jgi:hypothetical protein
MHRYLVLVIVIISTLAAARSVRSEAIQDEELEYQQQVFKKYWQTFLKRKLDDLPTEGEVPVFRVPYSGSSYPDAQGGTDVPVGSAGVSPLRKYDRAFNDGRSLATEYERRDVTRLRTYYYQPTGLFGMSRRLVSSAPGWHGHCNGWTAASIRHAEPQKSVERNGVTFTPADIKALLADIYMYSETEHLGGVDPVINPATLHITLTNWIGRSEHPVGMEATPGRVVYNYPIYAYKCSIHPHADREVEVRLTAVFGVNTRYELDRSPRLSNSKYFHYLLDLDEEGNIVGGRYFRDSSQVDMLWVPLKPVEGGEEGNEMGNPHISVKQVLAMWREATPQEVRQKWLNVDPLPQDAKLSANTYPKKLWGGWRPRRRD